MNETIRISRDEEISADFTSSLIMEYTTLEGRNLSQVAMIKDLEDATHEDMLRALQQRAESSRPLMLEDVEKLEKVIDYISEQPARDAWTISSSLVQYVLDDY